MTSSTGREWGVWLVDDVYYVSTWIDLPANDTEAIEKFFSRDRKDALIRGESIAEEHRRRQLLLPEEERVHTIPRRPPLGLPPHHHQT